MEILRTNNLIKKYGSITAVNNLNLTIDSGMLYGILGPNGSGKTTTLGLILDILKPNSGDYLWFEGQYYPFHRQKVGAILETPNFYPYLTGPQNLEIIKRIRNVDDSRIDYLLELVNLAHRKKSKFRTYSLGMKQRLAIAATLIGEPEVLIFDEPTNGLDPQGIAEVRNVLKQIASLGKTVILASHILDEVEKICTHVAIIKNGKLLADGPVGHILNEDQIIEINSENQEDLLNYLANHQGIHKVTTTPNCLECIADNELKVSDLNRYLFENNIVTTHLVSRKRKLEEEFLEITKEN